MLTSLIWTLGGLVLSGGGIWLAAAFVPSFALLLKSAIDFVRSPIGTVIAAVAGGFLLFSAAWVSGDLHGTAQTRAEWRADNVAKKAAADRVIAENKLRATADADKRIASIEAFANTLAEKVKKYESETPVRDGMRLTGDDIRRLLKDSFR
jgi:hypothetical protein